MEKQRVWNSSIEVEGEHGDDEVGSKEPGFERDCRNGHPATLEHEEGAAGQDDRCRPPTNASRHEQVVPCGAGCSSVSVGLAAIQVPHAAARHSAIEEDSVG